MVRKKVFTKRETGLGQLILGIIVFVIGLMWSIWVIKHYEIESNVIAKIQISFPLFYGIGLIIGGIVLIITGFKKLKRRIS